MILLITALVVGGRALMCAHCGGPGMIPCNSGPSLKKECPHEKGSVVSSCYVGVEEDTGLLVRDCLVLSSKDTAIRETMRSTNDVAKLITQKSVQRAFNFEWDQHDNGAATIKFNKRGQTELRSFLTSKSMCVKLCKGNMCNQKLAAPECDEKKLRKKRDLFLKYESLGEWVQSLLEKEIQKYFSNFDSLSKKDQSKAINTALKNVDATDEFMLSKLAHRANKEKNLDRVHITCKSLSFNFEAKIILYFM